LAEAARDDEQRRRAVLRADRRGDKETGSRRPLLQGVRIAPASRRELAVRTTRRVRRAAALLGAALAGPAGCTSYESAYERQVYDYEPTYCYRSLADVTCQRTPSSRDARQLVNYYGPARGKYPAAEPPEPARLRAPPAADGYVRDPEPRVRPAVAAVETPAPAIDPATGGSGTAGGEASGGWRSYLPILTVLFGAAQLAAAFLF
jgi:hypothetical protein